MKPLYSGEVQFRRYSDTSSQGQSVTFSLASREDLEAFIGMEGKRFAAVFVQIGDDEQPVDPPEPKAESRPAIGELGRWAAIRCTEAPFQEWVGHQLKEGGIREPEAAQYIRQVCGVESRKEIDTNPEAFDKFHRLIRIPYSKFLKGRQ